jgi:predicted CXXCH cytochrome family protein
VYFLVRKQTGRGGDEALDTEYEGAFLTLGGDADAMVQLPGVNGTLQLQDISEEGVRASSRKLTFEVHGKPVRNANLAVGDTLVLPGYELELIAPPTGFQLALVLRATEGVAPVYGEAMDLEQSAWRMRRYSWGAVLLVLVLTLLIPLIGLVKPPLAKVLRETPLPDDSLWSSGPLLAAHRTAGIATDCQACHTTPFVMVQDVACLACHRDLTEHVDLGVHPEELFAGERCASCHREHNEPALISRQDKSLCVDCHEAPNEWENGGENGPQAVTGFTASSHPEFRFALLQPQGPGGAHGWAVNRVAPGVGEPRETSNLKFTHKVHLDVEKVQQQTTGDALHCESCHTLKDDGEHFEPITMDQHCRSCHSLSFDVFEPELELPHGDLRAAIVAMEAHFIREFTDPTLRRQRAATKLRRVPGKRDSAASCSGSGLDCGRAEALKEAEYQFADTGCITCHVVVETDLQDINDRWLVQPIRVTGDWYPHGRFDHSSHLSQDRDEPGEVCESCHAVSDSEESADILIPGQDNCLDCHAEDSGQGVAVNCVGCHVFHRETATLSLTVRKEGKP